MKIGIKQEVLESALVKGAAAALSDDAQQDTSTLSLLIKSVKITVDKDFVVESGTNLMSVRHSIAAKEEDGIVVKEAGCVVIPAKEFYDWVKVQGKDSVIKMDLQKIPSPEVVATGDGEDAEAPTVKRIGAVKLSSAKKGASKTSGRWDLVCYDPECIPNVNYSAKSEKQFEVKGSVINDALTNVGFAALDKDWEKVFDSVSVQVYKKELYFLTTDTMRCALYKMPKDDVEIMSEKPMLIPVSLLTLVSKIIEKDEKATFSYSEENSRVFVSQPHLKVRLACTEKKLIEKFPDIKILLEKEYSALAEMNKFCLNDLLINAAIVNNASALFCFSKEDKSLVVKAISEDNKCSPTLKKADNVGTCNDTRVVWAVNHLIEGLKVIKADDIALQIPKNLKSVKITGKDNANFIYFCMAVNNPKYSDTDKTEKTEKVEKVEKSDKEE